MAKKFERKTVFIYEINGQEKVKVTSAEEAERWDQIFTVAEQVDQVLQDNPPELKLDEAQRTELSLYLAQHRNELLGVLAEEGEAVKTAPVLVQSKKKPEASIGSGASVKKQDFVKEHKRPVEPLKDGFSI